MDLIELIHLNDLLKEIAFLFRQIRGQEICYTGSHETDRQTDTYGLYSEVALAKKCTTPEKCKELHDLLSDIALLRMFFSRLESILFPP